MSRRLTPILLPLALGAVVVALWHLLVVLSGTRVFPLPSQVVRGLGELAARGVLLRYIGDSLLRVAVGFGLAVIAGVPLGFVMGLYPAAARTLNPVLQTLRPISPLAWIPVAIVLFGVSNGATFFLIFLASVFPIALSATSAVRGVPIIYMRAARNFGLSAPAMFARVVFPATLPELLVGLRVALGVSWLVVVAAEMIAVDSGLGYLIVDARNAGKRYDLVVGGMLLIGAVGLGLDLLFRRLERMRALRWGYRSERVI